MFFGLGGMHGFIEGIRRRFGVDMASTLHYYLGLEVRKEIFNRYASKFDIKSFDDLVSFINAMITGHAWGVIIDHEIHKKTIILRGIKL